MEEESQGIPVEEESQGISVEEESQGIPVEEEIFETRDHQDHQTARGVENRWRCPSHHLEVKYEFG